MVRIQTQLTIQDLQKELKSQNNQPKRAPEAPKTTQTTLGQAEEIGALRKVVAEVAHEINNPLSCIVCNIKPTQDYIRQLLALINLYQQKTLDPDPSITTYLGEINLELVSTDLSSTIHAMANSAERIRTAVLALQTLTCLDESDLKQVSLQEDTDHIPASLLEPIV